MHNVCFRIPLLDANLFSERIIFSIQVHSVLPTIQMVICLPTIPSDMHQALLVICRWIDPETWDYWCQIPTFLFCDRLDLI